MPLPLAQDTWQHFKKDFRSVARKELNSNTRSHIKKASGAGLDAADQDYPLAVLGRLPGHKFVMSFTLPAANTDWAYRRVPIPVKTNGVYLIEAVSKSHTSCTLVVKSNITCAIKQSDAATLVFAANRTSGTPLAGASVKIINAAARAPISAGTTGADGIFFIEKPTAAKSLILVSTGIRVCTLRSQFLCAVVLRNRRYTRILCTLTVRYTAPEMK